MVAVLSPQRGSTPAQHRVGLTSHLLASLAGGAVVGALFGALGDALLVQHLTDHAAVGLGIVASVSILLAFHELNLVELPIPQRRGQVPRDWWRTKRRGVYSWQYGLLLGAGIFTYVRFPGLHVVLLWIVFTASPWTGLVTFASFGFGRGLASVAAASATQTAEDVPSVVAKLDLFERPIHTINGFLLLGTGIAFASFSAIV